MRAPNRPLDFHVKRVLGRIATKKSPCIHDILYRTRAIPFFFFFHRVATLSTDPRALNAT